MDPDLRKDHIAPDPMGLEPYIVVRNVPWWWSGSGRGRAFLLLPLHWEAAAALVRVLMALPLPARKRDPWEVGTRHVWPLEMGCLSQLPIGRGSRSLTRQEWW